MKGVTKVRQLLSRTIFSLGIVFVYEIGKHVVFPGTILKTYLAGEYWNNISLVTGGDFSKMSYFSLGLGPYMSGMIFWRVIQSLNPDKISKLTENTVFYFRTLLILLIAAIQSLGLSLSMRSNISFTNNTQFNIMITTLVYTTGAMFVLWLVELNSQKGIGGPSLLILAGILSRFPNTAFDFFKENIYVWPTTYSVVLFVVTIVGLILMIGIITLVLDSEYRITVQRVMIRNELATPTYIPIKVLPANAMPYMFGLTFLSIPQLITPILKKMVPNFNSTAIENLTSLSNVQSIILYLVILIVLGYGFAFVNVNPTEISDDLKKNGDYILDVLPGSRTNMYITSKLMTMATVGNIITLVLLGIPMFLSLGWSELSSFSYIFGSLLILVSTVINIRDQASALWEKDRYPSILPYTKK